MADTLHYYTCPNRHCFSTATVAVRNAERWLRCPVDQRFLRYSHAVPIETDEQREWAKRGVVFHTGYVPEPWTCKRCDKAMPADAKRYWPISRGGSVPCCEECQHAQRTPTAEEQAELDAIAARVAAMKAADEAKLAQRMAQHRELMAKLAARTTTPETEKTT